MNSRTFDLNLLRVFDALMRERSVSRAAGRLALSQPAVSNALGRLRAAAKDPLFARVGQRMEPTPFALALAEPIQRGMADILDGLEHGGGFDPATSTRRFNIILSDVGEVVLLPRFLRQLQLLAPGIALSVTQLARAQYQAALSSGAADLAIGYLPPPSKGFHQQRLFDDGFVVILRSGHPLLKMIKSGRIGLKPYFGALHVAVRSPSDSGAAGALRLSSRSLRRQVALEVPHFMGLAGIVPHTDLIATVPRKVAQALGEYGVIKTANLPIKVPKVDVQLCWHSRQHDDLGNRWLRRIAMELFEAG